LVVIYIYVYGKSTIYGYLILDIFDIYHMYIYIYTGWWF
jgi:hypothetical protein